MMLSWRSHGTAFAARFMLAACLVFGSVALHTNAANAGLLSLLAKAGKGASVGKGAGAAKLGAGVLAADATGLIKVLPDADNVTRFAVQSGPDGIRLAGKSDVDLARYADADALDAKLTELRAASPDGTVEIYVDDYAYERNRAVFDATSRSGKAEIKVLVDKRNVASLSADGKVLTFADGLKVLNRPGVELRQIAYRMNAPLVGDQVRLLRFADDAPQLPSAREKVYGSKPLAPEPESVTASDLAGQLKRVRGQTVLVTGRVDGNRLIYRTGSGESSIGLGEIRIAGAEADVNLLVVDTGSSAQPSSAGVLRSGGFKPLAEALDARTYGEFLQRLAPRGQDFIVDANRTGRGHVAYSIAPVPKPTAPSNSADPTIQAIGVAADVARLAMIARDSDTEEEWSRRWFTERLSAGWNSLILLNLVFGLLAIRSFWRMSRWMLARLFGRLTNQWLRRALTLLLSFTMILFTGAIIGIPVLIWGYVLAIWNIVTWPFRKLLRKSVSA